MPSRGVVRPVSCLYELDAQCLITFRYYISRYVSSSSLLIQGQNFVNLETFRLVWM